MSAEILRRAASLMRERAEAATGGGWHSGGVWWENWTDAEGLLCHTPWPTVTTGATGAEIVAKACTEANAEHVARFADPVVALAVADLLDSEANAFVAHMERQADPERRFASVWLAATSRRHELSLAVARAYLGESA